MTREQWKKHKNVINWFYNQDDNTKVWVKYHDSEKWSLILYPEWHVESKYIINDEYSEFRKALADGKKVEIKAPSAWVLVTSEEDFKLGQPEDFRLKPDAPKFKKGDWVKFKQSYTFGHIIRLDDSVEIMENFIIIKRGKHIIDFKDMQLWIPERGEILWVGDELCKFIKQVESERDYEGKCLRNNQSHYCRTIEPFIGQIPVWVKEKF